MKFKYPLRTAIIVTLFLLGVYYFIPKSPLAFADMEPRFVELPEFKVTGFEIYGNLAKGDYSTAWTTVSNENHKIAADCQGGFTYGIESYQKALMSKWYYLAGCEMFDAANFAEEKGIQLTTRVIPKNRYVVFTYKGEITIKRIGALYGYIFAEWLPNNGYQRAGFYNFERYDKRFLGAKNHRSEFELFVPITPMTAR